MVIDRRNNDNTLGVALSRDVKIARANNGKGTAAKVGFTMAKTPYVAMLDSDMTYPARYIDDILELLQENDVVIAERHIRHDESMRLINLFGNKILSLLASLLYGEWTSDICTGMWGFRKSVIDKMDFKSQYCTQEAEFYIRACIGKYRIARTPITYRPRKMIGYSHFYIQHGIQIGWYLIRNRIGGISAE